MAQVQTQTYNLLIDLKDSTGSITTWRIDDPISNLSLQDVRNALAPAFENSNTTGFNILCTTAGYSLINVESARTELINKTVTDLL